MLMVVQDYEINLSLQEYFYFRDCSQKFRIYRILNPIPTKEGFLQTRNPFERYYIRDYQEPEIDGIKKHQFFAIFHQQYEFDIAKNRVPNEIVQDSVLMNFWEYQRKRFQKSLEEYPWKPLRTELPAMTKRQRGIIDSIEFINNNEELRIIDYKRSRHENDFESLYFYATLLEDFMNELNWEGLEISEIGCYYYLKGELVINNYDANLSENIREKIDGVVEEIKTEKFKFEENACDKCHLTVICNIMRMRENYK